MNNKPYVVAVCGGSGSGKTTVVDLLKKELDKHDKVIIFNQDHYYNDLSHLSHQEREGINFDQPESIDTQLLFEQFTKLSQGQSIDQPIYDFSSHSRTEKKSNISPGSVLIFDGIFSLYFEEVRKLCDLKVFVDVADDYRFIRRLTRDLKERGRTMEKVIKQYEQTVRPMHREFIAPSKRWADFVINWEEYNENTVKSLAKIIKHRE